MQSEKQGKKGLRAKVRIRIEFRGNTIIGPGKAELLRHIKALGSLRKAAETMGMSYRKAWYSIHQINESAPEEVVALSRGGKSGGNATLSAYGEKLLDNYTKISNGCQDFLDEQLKNSSL